MKTTSRKSRTDTASLFQTGDIQPVSEGKLNERLAPRPVRSKRGLTDGVETANCCFRIEVERHRNLKTYCASKGLEIGEFLDALLRDKGF